MARSYTQLTYDERCQIYALKRSGKSSRAIGLQLQRDPETIRREIRRNSGSKGYRYKQAQEKSHLRRIVASKGAYKMTEGVKRSIESLLIEYQWSPEQISGWLAKEGREHVSHERIYQYIWQDKQAGGTLYTHLRHRGKKYHKRGAGNKRRGIIPGRIDIDQRPDIVAKKERVGDWEADTIIGKSHRGAMLSLVDRASKYTILFPLAGKHAAPVTKAIRQVFGKITPLVHTITFDNGKEFAGHQEIAQTLDAQCFFAKPYHSWERGLNEHTNGLVRQYFPKSTDLTMVTNDQVRTVQHLLNNRPRKSLAFKTPLEVFLAALYGHHPNAALHC